VTLRQVVEDKRPRDTRFILSSFWHHFRITLSDEQKWKGAHKIVFAKRIMARKQKKTRLCIRRRANEKSTSTTAATVWNMTGAIRL
jgi:hypothetical protein